MAWIKVKGGPGVLYVPTQRASERKHNCPDCFYCQMCSELRCIECRKKPASSKAGGACNKAGCPKRAKREKSTP